MATTPQDSSAGTPSVSSAGTPSDEPVDEPSDGESESEVQKRDYNCSLCKMAGHRAFKTPQNGKMSIPEERFISCINHPNYGQVWTSGMGPAPPIPVGKGKGKGKGKGPGKGQAHASPDMSFSTFSSTSPGP